MYNLFSYVMISALAVCGLVQPVSRRGQVFAVSENSPEDRAS